MSAWSEGKIGRILARNTFADQLCVLPNCVWTGHEADLLVVTRTCRIIDVEIKISRADLKADASKDKWWHYPAGRGWARKFPREPREWPTKTWKHYYALPADIWRDELMQHVQPVSGVLLIRDRRAGMGFVECIKRAKPCPKAPVLTNEQVVAIARLASLRMWDAYSRAERADERALEIARAVALRKEAAA